jgi:flagellar assembly protein FliH
LPKIIRATGVNMDRAHPLIAPLRGKNNAEMQALLQAQESGDAEKRREMEKIHASAEIIVEEIINKARNDADNMLVNAREETIKVLQEAVREGREQGMNETLREMRALEAKASQEIDEAVQTLLDERTNMARELERDVIELVFDIVEKILDVEMKRNSEWIAAMVKTALQQMEGGDGVVMKVSAEARQKVSDIAERMLAQAGKSGSLTILADSSFPPGGCIVDTGRGMIDAGVESKLDRLKTVLRENA